MEEMRERYERFLGGFIDFIKDLRDRSEDMERINIMERDTSSNM